MLSRLCYCLLILTVLAISALVIVRIETSTEHIVHSKLREIQKGMTVQEVQAVMRRYAGRVEEWPGFPDQRQECWTVGEARGITVESRQQQRKEQGELPIVARFKECLFLFSREEFDRPGVLDRDAVNFQHAEWILGIRGQVPPFGGVIE